MARSARYCSSTQCLRKPLLARALVTTCFCRSTSERPGIGDLSNPILQFDYSLMVPAGSAIAKVADIDRPDIRIAAGLSQASTNELRRQV